MSVNIDEVVATVEAPEPEAREQAAERSEPPRLRPSVYDLASDLRRLAARQARRVAD